MLWDAAARREIFQGILDQSRGLKDYLAVLTALLLASFNIMPNQLLIGVTFKDGSSIVLVYSLARSAVLQPPSFARAFGRVTAFDQPRDSHLDRRSMAMRLAAAAVHRDRCPSLRAHRKRQMHESLFPTGSDPRFLEGRRSRKRRRNRRIHAPRDPPQPFDRKRPHTGRMQAG
jgi:hypothetical protein